MDIKEKPIIYSTAMVKARRAGLKTQTRRVITQVEQHQIESDIHDKNYLYVQDKYGDSHHLKEFCPYEINQTVWIRETWSMPAYFDDLKPSEIDPKHVDEIRYKADDEKASGKTRPSIYYPRWAARSFDKITNIRIERIQDILVDDCLKEGINVFSKKTIDEEDSYYEVPAYWENPEGKIINTLLVDFPVDAFANLWDSINKKRGYGWDKNPYVWVYDFEVIK